MKTCIIRSTKFNVLLALLLSVSASLSVEPVPHHFSGLTVAPNQTVTLGLDGTVSGMFNLTGTISNQFQQMLDLYIIEASTNLADWTRIAMLPRTNSDPNPLLFQDTNAPGLSHRFYRTFTNHLLTAFPNPTGPFAVGTVDRVMMDPARTNLYRYSPRTNAFMVKFWYPADPPPAGLLPAAMWDTRLATDTSLYTHFGLDKRWAWIVPRLVGHRFAGVPLAAGLGRCPVVVYSHGGTGSRNLASQIAEELASHGYVVAAPDHTDCYATEFPDGRYLTGSSSDVASRLKDMKFLVDALAGLNDGDPLFAGRLDLDRIGVSGISMGGIVYETCRSDSRVKCAAVWDGTTDALSGRAVQKPFLAALGEDNMFYSSNLSLYNLAKTNAVLLQIRGAYHVTASDAGWTAQIPGGRGPAMANNACLVWFFDTYLKGQTPSFPTNSEIYNVQRK